MSVFRRGRLSVVRLAIGLGVLAAFPFVASGVAQAAMAGGNPLTTTNRPDLRTIHVSVPLDQATFCFDKTVSNTGFGGGSLNPLNFTLGGYRFDVAVAMISANLSSSNQQCIVGTVTPKSSTYGGGTRDLNSYTFGTVARQTVIANAGGAGAPGNIADSTAQLDSASHSGTADHTQAPDLQSVSAPDTTNNNLIYTFDKRTNAPCSATPACANGISRFYFIDQNGVPHFGVPIGADSVGDVLVHFCTGGGDSIIGAPYCAFASTSSAGPPFVANTTPDSVSTAVRAAVIRTDNPNAVHFSTFCAAGAFGCTAEGNPANKAGAVTDYTGEAQFQNPTETVAVPGTAGTTARPDLISAAIVQASGNPTNQVDFTFDQPVTTNVAASCVVVLSNSQEIQGDTESVISPNTVRVTYSSAALQNFQELAVKASAYSNFPSSCVMGVNTVGGSHPLNTAGGVSIGDNAGANGSGYTTGPDFRSVTFDNSTGTVTLQADQRIAPGSVGFGGWTLLASDGTVITATANSAAVANNAPYQSQVVLGFFPTDLARAVAIEVSGPPACGNDGSAFAGSASFTFGQGAAPFGSNGSAFSPQGNVCQVIAPTAPGVAFADPAKGKVHVRWHHLSRKQVAAALRRLHRRHRR